MWLDGKEQVKRLVFDDTCLQASGVALWVSLGEIFRASSQEAWLTTLASRQAVSP